MKKNKITYDIFIRYILLFLFALGNLYIFYFLLKPLTIYASYFLFNISYGAVLLPPEIILVANTFQIKLINPCIAGSAYYLLLILNLSTPQIKFNKRLMLLLTSFLALFILNLFRIYFLGILFFENFYFFDLAHKFFWYFLSVFFVIGIWFSQVKIFKIKQVPFYSDIKVIYKNSLFNKKCSH